MGNQLIRIQDYTNICLKVKSVIKILKSKLYKTSKLKFGIQKKRHDVNFTFISILKVFKRSQS